MVIAETSQRGPEATSLPRRPWWSRASGAQILMVVVGIAAFVGNLAVLGSAENTVRVAVATADLASGTRLDPGLHLDWVEVAADQRVVSSLVTGEQSDLSESVVVSAIREGDVVTDDDLSPASLADRSRAFSIPVRIEHAVGGVLVPGDRIDVIAIEGGAARYVVTDIEVVAVPSGGQRGAFSSTGAYHVTVAVDDRQALDIAESLALGDVRIVRSTGAEPVADLDDRTGGP